MEEAINIFNVLTKNENSLFYGADRTTKTQINTANKSDHPKHKAFLGFYWKMKMSYILVQNNQEKTTTVYIHFIER